MNHYVYEITNNINGKKYIGKRSCNCPIENDKYMGSGKALLEAIKKYGIENFSKNILKVCESEKKAYSEEKKFIEEANAVNDRKYYNIIAGGLGISSDYMKERWKDKYYRESHRLKLIKCWQDKSYREKQSLRMKEVSNMFWNNEKNRLYISNKLKEYCSSEEVKMQKSMRVKGKNNPMYGKKHTEECKRRIRNASIELWNNEEYRNKTVEAIRKAKRTKEHTEKISNLNSGNRNPMFGKRHAEETKTKISNSKKGKNTGANNHNSKKVILLNTNEIFNSLAEAERKYNICRQDIGKCCRGQRKSAGKINNEKAIWKYLN